MASVHLQILKTAFAKSWHRMHLLSGAKIGTLHGSGHNSACVTEGLLYNCHISKIQGPTRPAPHTTQLHLSLLRYSHVHSCEDHIQNPQLCG